MLIFMYGQAEHRHLHYLCKRSGPATNRLGEGLDKIQGASAAFADPVGEEDDEERVKLEEMEEAFEVLVVLLRWAQ